MKNVMDPGSCRWIPEMFVFVGCVDRIINRIIRSTVLYEYSGQKKRIIQLRFKYEKRGHVCEVMVQESL